MWDRHARQGWRSAGIARQELSQFTEIASLDIRGQWLQYYSFRFGDVMLSITIYLLAACTMQTQLSLKHHKYRLLPLGLLGLILFTQITFFSQQAIASQNFPTQQQDVSPRWKSMSEWIKRNTESDAIFVTHPGKLANFTWMTQRITVVKLKMFPQTKAAIVEYYQRLNDLSGGDLEKIYFGNEKLDQVKTVKAIGAGFSHLSTERVITLMDKYQSDYFLADLESPLDLPVAYVHAPYILYKQNYQ